MPQSASSLEQVLLFLMLLGLPLAGIVLDMTSCASPAANVQTIRSQKKIEKKLAEEQAQPFDGGSVRKSFKRILK